MTWKAHTVVVTLAGVAAGLGTGLASGRADADTKVVAGYTQSAQSIVGRTVDHFKEKAEEFSNGALEVQVYPSSQLGTFGAMVTQMKSGLVNVIFIQPDALGEQVPIATSNSWPFLFDDQEEMLKAWNGPGGQQLVNEVEERSGYRMLAPTWNQARWIYTTREATGLDDLTGMKIRVPGTAVYVGQLELLGLSPTPMNIAEVFTAMQQGVVEGIEGALSDMAGFSIQDVANTVVMTGHVMSPKAWLTWGEWIDDMPEADREAFMRAAEAASKFYSETLQSEDERLRKGFEAKGIEFVEPGKSKDEMREMTRALAEQLPEIHKWAEILAGRGDGVN